MIFLTFEGDHACQNSQQMKQNIALNKSPYYSLLESEKEKLKITTELKILNLEMAPDEAKQ